MTDDVPVSKPGSNLDKLGVALVQQLSRTIDEGVGPLSGAREYAESRRQLTGDTEKAVRRVVRETIAAAGATGFATALAG